MRAHGGFHTGTIYAPIRGSCDGSFAYELSIIKALRFGSNLPTKPLIVVPKRSIEFRAFQKAAIILTRISIP